MSVSPCQYLFLFKLLTLLSLGNAGSHCECDSDFTLDNINSTISISSPHISATNELISLDSDLEAHHVILFASDFASAGGSRLTFRDQRSRVLLEECSRSADCVSRQGLPGGAISVHFTAPLTHTVSKSFRVEAMVLDLRKAAPEKSCECPKQTIRLQTNEQRIISSPNFPAHYPNYCNCSWAIYPALNATDDLEIAFQSFSTENIYDKVYISHVGSHGQDQHKMMCTGSSCDGVRSASRGLVVRFFSDATNSAEGFSAVVTALPKKVECSCSSESLVLAADQVLRISSPGWPVEFYPNDCSCEWNILAPPGFHIAAHVKKMDTEYTNDALTFYDSFNAGKALQSCSGSSQCWGVRSSGRELRLSFRSDESVSGPGFTLNLYASRAGQALAPAAPHRSEGGLSTAAASWVVLAVAVALLGLVGATLFLLRRRRRRATLLSGPLSPTGVASRYDPVPEASPPSYEDSVLSDPPPAYSPS